MRRRGVGIGAIKKKEERKKQFETVGHQLSESNLAHVQSQLAVFQDKLENFALKYKKNIRKDPHFRQHFQNMCSKIGVDPLASKKGFWSELLDMGDFYYELGVQILEIGILTRDTNGGLLLLSQLMHLLSQKRSSYAQKVSEDDVRRSVQKLRVLGEGFNLIELGEQSIVVTVPIELSSDHSVILTIAQENKGKVSTAILKGKLGWDEKRIEIALTMMLKEGMVWVDKQRAFNAEISRIKETVRSNELAGKMRLQWWRERLATIYDQNEVRDHVLVASLADAIRQHDLTKRWFDRLIDAREDDFDLPHFNDLDSMEMYAEKTASSLLYLTLECLNVRDDLADTAASHAGCAIGMGTLLRGTKYHCLQENVYIPLEILEKYGFTPESFILQSNDPKMKENTCDVVYEVACQANAHLEEARSLRNKIPMDALPAFLPVVSTSIFLKKLEKANFNIYDPELEQSHGLHYKLQLWKSSFQNSY